MKLSPDKHNHTTVHDATWAVHGGKKVFRLLPEPQVALRAPQPSVGSAIRTAPKPDQTPGTSNRLTQSPLPQSRTLRSHVQEPLPTMNKQDHRTSKHPKKAGTPKQERPPKGPIREQIVHTQRPTGP